MFLGQLISGINVRQNEKLMSQILLNAETLCKDFLAKIIEHRAHDVRLSNFDICPPDDHHHHDSDETKQCCSEVISEEEALKFA